MRPRELRSRAGFTLVEALVSLGIFAVAMGALMPLAISNVRANANGAVRTEALALAQEQIEGFRATTFSDLPAVGTSGSSAPGGGFTREWEVRGVPASQTCAGDGDDLRRVRVVVRWSRPTSSGSVTLTTTKTRY